MTSQMMSIEEIRHLPVGTLVEDALGHIWRLVEITRTHIKLQNTLPRPALERTGIGQQWREYVVLTHKVASRLLITTE